MHHEVGADRTSLHWSTVARLNFWAVERPDTQYAVMVCSKVHCSSGSQRLAKTMRAARYVKICPDTVNTYVRVAHSTQPIHTLFFLLKVFAMCSGEAELFAA